VLLHQPFGEEGHPGKVGPSVGINLPKVVSLNGFYVVKYFGLVSGTQQFLSQFRSAVKCFHGKLPYRTF
jgi:hypothetical protein